MGPGPHPNCNPGPNPNPNTDPNPNPNPSPNSNPNPGPSPEPNPNADPNLSPNLNPNPSLDSGSAVRDALHCSVGTSTIPRAERTQGTALRMCAPPAALPRPLRVPSASVGVTLGSTLSSLGHSAGSLENISSMQSGKSLPRGHPSSALLNHKHTQLRQQAPSCPGGQIHAVPPRRRQSCPGSSHPWVLSHCYRESPRKGFTNKTC